VQPGEVRTSIGIASHNLTVEHGSFDWQLVQQLRDGGKRSVKSRPLRL